MDLLQLLSTGMALFVSMSIECITGFGGAVLAMPVLTMFLDVDSAVALMAMISGVNGARIYLQNRGKTDRAILRTVLLFGGCGLPVGMLLGGYSARAHAQDHPRRLCGCSFLKHAAAAGRSGKSG